MPRRKREKIPMNTRKVKEASWQLVSHNAKSGAGAFKKRLRHQYTRRERARLLGRVADSWEENEPKPIRLWGAPEPRSRTIHRLDDTLRIAMKEAGIE